MRILKRAPRYLSSLTFSFSLSMPLVLTLAFPIAPLQSFAAENPVKSTSASIEMHIDLSNELRSALQEKLTALGNEYTPRTKHLNPDGSPVYTNRLIFESSPYLLQHAHNPVNWYSWSEEALKTAKAQNKPIFLSVGYATCHWCHVMEEESFENKEIAAFLNKHFISIKVDREQLPDIDHTYMLAAAISSGQTGWPLNSFNTPDAHPFYATTYFPPQAFKEFIGTMAAVWEKTPHELEIRGQANMDAIKRISLNNRADEGITTQTALAATEQWLEQADVLEGGFGTAPKFPNEPTLMMLMDQSIRHQDTELWEQIELTLKAMAQGGIYDQIGGGFHRYATDPSWNIPHFEKMLYNQAQLSLIYLRAYETSSNPIYKRTAEQTLDYILREMTSPEGLFYSATDADSEGEEGTFFLWDKAQLETVLTTQEAELASELYGVNNGHNFEGKNILYLPASLPEFVIDKGYPPQAFIETLNDINQKLLKARAQRIPPLTDNKAITSWNSLMIRSLAQATTILGDTQYLQAAITAANTLWDKHYLETGLIRDTRDAVIGQHANLEDYAFFALANLSLYDITQDERWLARTQTLIDDMLDHFWDDTTDTLYLSRNDSLLPIRAKDRGDGAIPGATSVAYEVLAKLGARQHDQRYSTTAERILSSISGNIRNNPMQYSYLLMAHENQNKAINKIQFGAQGALRAELLKQGSEYQLHVSMKPGWHINAQQPGYEKLVGSQVSAPWVTQVSYPNSVKKAVSFAPNPISLYEDEMVFAIASTPSKKPLTELLEFTFQACSKKQCLAPETLSFSSAIH